MKKYSVTQVSSLRRKTSDWYERPVPIKISFHVRKSTIIILILLAYILFLHYHHKNPVVIRDLPPTLAIDSKSPVSAISSPSKPSFGQLAVYVAPAPVIPVSTVVANCGDNQYAAYIYNYESGCNTSSVNSIGCRGIGQACPGDKLPCGADYACQNAYFTAYAISRYGSWEAAYNQEKTFGWW